MTPSGREGAGEDEHPSAVAARRRRSERRSRSFSSMAGELAGFRVLPLVRHGFGL